MSLSVEEASGRCVPKRATERRIESNNTLNGTKYDTDLPTAGVCSASAWSHNSTPVPRTQVLFGMSKASAVYLNIYIDRRLPRLGAVRPQPRTRPDPPARHPRNLRRRRESQLAGLGDRLRRPGRVYPEGWPGRGAGQGARSTSKPVSIRSVHRRRLGQKCMTGPERRRLKSAPISAWSMQSSARRE